MKKMVTNWLILQKYEVLKYGILREQEDDQENLTRYLKKFEFMLKSESDFPKYKATYIKFLPYVYMESNYPKFEFKKFSFMNVVFSL